MNALMNALTYSDVVTRIAGALATLPFGAQTVKVSQNPARNAMRLSAAQVTAQKVTQLFLAPCITRGMSRVQPTETHIKPDVGEKATP
ncbi:MAG: hypothetical protein JWN98_769 [Abditibacteriota bacterium]|nr:hypothetical protein [Abditibacteriota bacterium]